MSSPAYTFEDTFKGADIDPDYSNGQNYFKKKKVREREWKKRENKKNTYNSFPAAAALLLF